MSWAQPAEAEQWKREFGARVRELRLRRGLSQIQLAHLADLDPTYLSGVEQGRRNIALVNIRVLALALDTTVCDLFSYEGVI